MPQKSEIFKQHHDNYLAQIARIDFTSVQQTLGLEKKGVRYFLPFFGRDYLISREGIQDDAGQTPDYTTCAILAKYLILCPERVHEDSRWAAFKDFNMCN